MIFPVIPSIITYSSALYRSGKVLFAALGTYMTLKSTYDLNDDYAHVHESARLENEMEVENQKISDASEIFLNSYDEAEYNPADNIESKISRESIAVPASGALLPAFYKMLEVSNARLEEAKEANVQLISQNEILYDYLTKFVSLVQASQVTANTFSTYLPLISQALIQSAANVKVQRENTVAVQTAETQVSVSNLSYEPVVNVAAPTVNNSIDFTPVSEGLTGIASHLSSVAANAISQKAVADYSLAPQTVLDSELQPLASGTPLAINTARNAAQAKNETDEAEFELDDDLIDSFTGA